MGRDANPLQSRDDNGYFCTPVPGQPWNSVDYASVSQAIISLSNSAQQFTIGGGPGYCVGLSCEGDAGIYLCNDVRPCPLSLPSTMEPARLQTVLLTLTSW
jgi:hypothetical protein